MVADRFGVGFGQFLGRAAQCDPIKPTLKAPGTKRMKLQYGKLLPVLLSICFQFQLAPLHLGTVISAASLLLFLSPSLNVQVLGRALLWFPFQLNMAACSS
jgi:hypothetical protein